MMDAYEAAPKPGLLYVILGKVIGEAIFWILQILA